MGERERERGEREREREREKIEQMSVRVFIGVVLSLKS